MMQLHQLIYLAATIKMLTSMQFSPSPTSEMSTDDKIIHKGNKSMDLSEADESGHEVETEVEDKKFLDDAMKAILDPKIIIAKQDVVDNFKNILANLSYEVPPIDIFMFKMDELSLEICKNSQQSLWSYVTDINNETKKDRMVRVATVEDEIKKQYWNLLKKNYLSYQNLIDDEKYKRKIRLIKERGTNVQMPQSKQREEINLMQKVWSRVSICAINANCTDDNNFKSMNDIITFFKTSEDAQALSYYWKSYRDATGAKIRPVFKDYVERMNTVALTENFSDAGEMWRYAFEDDDFVNTVNKIWSQIKPFYDVIHEYVKKKLQHTYPDILTNKNNYIPAHLLGNLWAQEWQSVYSRVTPYPEHQRPHVVESKILQNQDFFDAVDSFYQSLGFESAKHSYEEISETVNTPNCLPSSHDMCDGVHYKVKWCGEKITDISVGLSRAARLLGHVQYFKHYSIQPPLYRDGPNPAFHDAVSEVVALQVTQPEYLKQLNYVEVQTGYEQTMNRLFWLSLEKIPLMGYAYVLDKWRWDIFSDSKLESWNKHWWDLRMKETRISPPVPRSENDLDPASKYHVVSHVQYITYLISHVLEFQILKGLCKAVNHTGPLHDCSLYGVKEAGKRLSEGMALGASQDWRTVLKVISGDSDISTDGFQQYFSYLKEFLEKEISKMEDVSIEDMDSSTPIIVGIVIVILVIIIAVMFCIKKYKREVFAVIGLSKNGSLDIAANEIPTNKNANRNAEDGVCENKV